MRVTQRVKKLLSLYESDNPGTKTALARVLMEGKLAGSGRALILPIDHSFSKGLIPNPAGSDPQYHFQLAVDAGLSALAAPMRMLEAAADAFAGSMPLILQMNSGEAFAHHTSDGHSPIRASLRDALRLGCAGVACTINPTQDKTSAAFEDIVQLVEEAKSYGLFAMIWASADSGAAGSETALDGVSHAAGVASAIGAHLVCVKVPASHLENSVAAADPVRALVTAPLSDRVRHVRKSCGNGRRIVVFAGEDIVADSDLFEDIRGIRDGGGHGYVLPANSLYRPYDPALQILDESVRIYQGKA